MFFKIIEYNSSEYKQMIDLRHKILRIPLGLTFTEDQLSVDKYDTLLGAFAEKENTLIACCILSKVDNETIKLRQMVVSEAFQGKGVGKKLIAFAENTALERGFCKIIMNARKHAEDFYQKLGYKIIGDEFIEVTIPHYRMEKTIS